MNSHSHKLTQLGFSLIEAMIGTAVLGIVFLALPPAFLSMRISNAETESMQRSTNLATSQLEYLRTLEFSTLEAMTESGGELENETVTHPSRHNITYTVQTDITYGSDELDGMLDAVVSVTWTENKRNRETVARAFFASDGMSDKKFPDAN